MLKDHKLFKVNTVGSRSSITKKEADLAYIAGFLDGDGSLMLQIKKRSDSPRGWRFMATVCFYQDSRHDEPLNWLRQSLGIGYLSKRKDGMTELRINGHKQCHEILVKLYPFIKFKKHQADYLLSATRILQDKRLNELSLKDRRKIWSCIIGIQERNYKSAQRHTGARMKKILGLTP